MMTDTFVADMLKTPKRAREQMADGAITDAYKAGPKQVISVLNKILATEPACVLRYKRHTHAAKGLRSLSVKSAFLEHAKEEQEHAEDLISLLGHISADESAGLNV